jgi:vacuolar-type H+-ATPase subunit C/Vma6
MKVKLIKRGKGELTQYDLVDLNLNTVNDMHFDSVEAAKKYINKKNYTLVENKLMKKETLSEMIRRIVKEEKDLPNTNITIRAFGKDVNGNKVVKLSFYDGTNFSIQTNGNLPKTHSLASAGKKVDSLTDSELNTVRTEVVDYIKQYGNKNQDTPWK